MRLRAALAVAAAAGALAACGGDDDTGGEDRGARAATGPARPAAASPADPGLRVWAAQGCGSCHTFAAAGAKGSLGPDLGQTLRGAPRALIRTGIVDPAAATAPGYGTGTMPEDYARRMSRAELERLVAFIDRGAR